MKLLLPLLLLLASCSYSVQLENGKTVELKRSKYESPIEIEVNIVEMRKETRSFSCSYHCMRYKTWTVYRNGKSRTKSGMRSSTCYGNRSGTRTYLRKTHKDKYKKKKSSRLTISKVITRDYYTTLYHSSCR